MPMPSRQPFDPIFVLTAIVVAMHVSFGGSRILLSLYALALGGTPFLIGMVVAFMGAVQLKKFGAEIFTVNLVGVAVLRELGVLITAILIAGRSGTSV